MRLLGSSIAIIVLACRGSAPPTPATPGAATDSIQRPTGPVVTVPRAADSLPGQAPRPITAPQRTGPDNIPRVTVRELLSTDAYVGRRVLVRGRCLGYTASVAVGGPPLTRSDWQLEEGGEAIFVSGPLPEGCSATAGSTVSTTILADVAQDTLPRLGGRPAVPRRYLVRVRP